MPRASANSRIVAPSVRRDRLKLSDSSTFPTWSSTRSSIVSLPRRILIAFGKSCRLVLESLPFRAARTARACADCPPEACRSSAASRFRPAFRENPAASACVRTHSRAEPSGLRRCLADDTFAGLDALFECVTAQRKLFDLCSGRTRDPVSRSFSASRLRRSPAPRH